MASARQRSESDYEEALVTKFIDATVNLESNVKFPTEAPSGLAPRVLVLLPEEHSSAKKPAFWNADLDAAASEASAGTLYSTSASLHGSRTRVNIGLVPTQASRHNCPVRPDVIVNFVTGALANGKKTDPLDVYSALPDGHEAAIAQAVAKGANRTFTAKGKKWDESFLSAAVAVRVVFNNTINNAGLEHIASGVQLAMRLGDAPACLLDTVTFAEITKRYGEKLGYKFSEIRGEELREKGYGGIYGVGKAAEYPPALVTLEYKPKEGIAPKDKIALVGKGLIYDTGGLNVKTPFNNMGGMKMDMCGSSAVFAGFVTLVRLGAPYHLVAALGMADNAIGPRAQRPDDIVLLKCGLSIEINNTDAEGRLVLADSVHHVAREIEGFTPSVVVDMATLTGAQLVCTGQKHAAIFSSSEEWEGNFVKAGKHSGDVCFPILFCPEFHNPQYESKVADSKNLPALNDQPTSCAGMFMTNALGKDFKGAHVHVDLAGPAMSSDRAISTGYGVALLAQVFGK